MTKFFGLLSALLGLVLLSGCGSSGGASVQAVGPQAFLSRAAQSGVVTVDVRTPSEYAAGHVQGAINIDVEAPTFAAEIAKLDKKAAYAVYCHSGRRSTIATTAMGKAGFTHVDNLSGGYADLVTAGASTAAS